MKSVSVDNGQSLGRAKAAETAGRRYRVMHQATWAVPHVDGVEMHLHRRTRRYPNNWMFERPVAVDLDSGPCNA